jgi:hypothetical protein
MLMYAYIIVYHRYNHVNFRDKGSWFCNDLISPVMKEDSYDGITADPFELMFVKYKEQYKENSWSKIAATYDEWSGLRSGEINQSSE